MLEMNSNGPPWPTLELWRAANQAVTESIERHQSDLVAAMDLGQRIRARIEALDPPMDDLCARTCVDCQEPCCARSRVWFDFKDLIYLHLGAPAIPTHQLIASMNQTCRFFADIGCVLPRVQRPFVCTWYICAVQKEHLRRLPKSAAQFLFNSLQALKTGRHQLENLFIHSVNQRSGCGRGQSMDIGKAR